MHYDSYKGVLNTGLCDKVCQRLVAGLLFSLVPQSIKLTATI